MKSSRCPAATGLRKAPTGIAGFDEISGGGLPHGLILALKNTLRL